MIVWGCFSRSKLLDIFRETSIVVIFILWTQVTDELPRKFYWHRAWSLSRKIIITVIHDVWKHISRIRELIPKPVHLYRFCLLPVFKVVAICRRHYFLYISKSLTCFLKLLNFKELVVMRIRTRRREMHQSYGLAIGILISYHPRFINRD